MRIKFLTNTAGAVPLIDDDCHKPCDQSSNTFKMLTPAFSHAAKSFTWAQTVRAPGYITKETISKIPVPPRISLRRFIHRSSLTVHSPCYIPFPPSDDFFQKYGQNTRISDRSLHIMLMPHLICFLSHVVITLLSLFLVLEDSSNLLITQLRK